jgi:hypothetical protein
VLYSYLPGNVHMSVLCLVPTTGRDSTARGVCFSPAISRDRGNDRMKKEYAAIKFADRTGTAGNQVD